MLVVEPMPVVRRLAGNAPALIDDVTSGSPKLASSSRVGRMSMVCMNSA